MKTHSIKAEVLQDRKIHCLQAGPCIFQPGNFTGWGSERVNACFHRCWGIFPHWRLSLTGPVVVVVVVSVGPDSDGAKTGQQ